MPDPITIFKGSTGLNMKIDPARLSFNPETGITDLAAAYNIDYDYTGRITRRKGYNQKIAVSAHSLFCERDAFFVTGTSLCLLYQDLSGYREIATVTEGARVSYAQVADMTFWVNGFEKGVIQNGVNSDWVKGDYYGPTSHRVLSDPPIGTIVRAFNGRMYIAMGSWLFYSDPFSLNAFDLSRGFLMFEGQIQMVAPVAGGIFVGTDIGVWYLSGNGPQRFEQRKVSTEPVFRGTDAKVNLASIGLAMLTEDRVNEGEGVMWTGPEGIYLGAPGGRTYHLSSRKITGLSATEGAGQIVNGRYICTL